jgi:hypothetical protein
MPDHLLFEGRLTAADAATRTITGRLLPFGEAGRTSAGTVTASRGVITWPDRPAEILLNLGHDGDRPVGRATSIVEGEDGLVASFAIAATPGGDQLLAEAAAGLRTGLSVELDEYSIRAGALTAGYLTGVGAVVRPAFASATLSAAEDTTTTDSPATTTTTATCPVCGEDLDLAVSALTDEAAGAPAPTCPACGAWLAVATPAAPDSAPAQEDPMPETALAGRTQARRPATAPAGTHPRPLTAATHTPAAAAALIAAAAVGRIDARQLSAALSDVVAGGAGNIYGLTQQDGWLGELWSGREFQRRYVGLVSSGAITGMKIRGWQWVTKPVVADYAGNKAAVPSNTVAVEEVVEGVERCAGAWDIDRAFWDLGDAGWIESFWRATVESYARLSDLRAGTAIVAAATANPTTPGAVPAGVSAGMAAIIDGALAIMDKALPTFALVAPDLYRGVLLTRSDDTLSYLNAALGLEDGTLGGFRILPATAGLGLGAGQVVVGASQAVTFYELGSTPIRVDAENVANGGRDIGAFGYTGSIVNEGAAITLVDTTP